MYTKGPITDDPLACQYQSEDLMMNLDSMFLRQQPSQNEGVVRYLSTRQASLILNSIGIPNKECQLRCEPMRPCAECPNIRQHHPCLNTTIRHWLMMMSAIKLPSPWQPINRNWNKTNATTRHECMCIVCMNHDVNKPQQIQLNPGSNSSTGKGTER